MRILIVHNHYQFSGGEDTVFELERNMLLERGNQVKSLEFDNKKITGLFAKLKTGLQSIYNFQSARLLKKEIQAFNPDIIHVHNFFPLASPSIFYIAHKFKIPIVMTLHNYRLVCANALLFRDGKICELCIQKKIPLQGILKKCYRNSYLQSFSITAMAAIHKLIGTWQQKIDSYIVLSEFAKQKYIHSSLQIEPDKIYVKPNFVTDLGFEKHQRDNYYLFIGRLSDEKRIQTIIEAAKKYSFHIKFIGDGPDKEFVELATKANSNIEYLGFQNKAFIIEQLKKSKALIFSSVWYEGMPMTILEAFSSGTPIIASKVGILSTLVTHLHNGLHFEPGNSEDLVLKIKYFDENLSKLEHLYSNARSTFIEKYTPEINYNLLMNIYQQTIDRKKDQINE